MQGKKQKPKVRFTRNEDGTLGVPYSSAAKSDDLAELWGQQKQALKTPLPTLKEEAKNLHKSVLSRKGKKNNKTSAKQPAKLTHNGVSNKSTNITFTIPKLGLPKQFTYNKKPVIILTLAIAVIIGATWLFFTSRDINSTASNSNGEVAGAVTSAIQTGVTPSFPTLTPNGNGVEDLGGFANIAPSGSPPVYVFTDAIGDKKIKVSQQQLPDSLRSEQATKLKELAESFNAKTPLEIGDNTAYIGASANGAQSIVYIKGENLVLIASEDTITNADWVTYIGNLKY